MSSFLAGYPEVGHFWCSATYGIKHSKWYALGAVFRKEILSGFMAVAHKGQLLSGLIPSGAETDPRSVPLSSAICLVCLELKYISSTLNPRYKRNTG